MTDFRVTDHLLDNDDDDEYEGNTTTPFQPDYNSTPGPSGEDIPMTKMNRGQGRGQKLLKYLSLKVILLIHVSSLKIRRRGTPLPEFILGQRLRNFGATAMTSVRCARTVV